MISSYPKVYSLGHRYIADIFDSKNGVIIEEKIDGSQISFGVIHGALHIRSKGREMYVEHPEPMFEQGVKAIQERTALLTPGFVYRGEYLRTPKHNTLSYARIPEDHIIIFDIEDSSSNPVDIDTKLSLAADIGFEVVPGYTLGIRDKKAFDALLETESILGGEKIEGIVIKNYERVLDNKKYMVGKYVSEKFKERHSLTWKSSGTQKREIVDSIIAALKTEARYLKSLQALKDEGLFTNSPSDIGQFIKTLHKDIDDEERDYIAGVLVDHFIPQIKRGVCGGAAEWYKEQCVVNVFETTNEEEKNNGQ